MRVYISGPVTGTADYMGRFREAERQWEAAGHDVVNPAKVIAQMPRGLTHRECMRLSIGMLGLCDAIYLMEGWAHSSGCNEEAAYALQNGITVFQEGRG